MIQKWIVCHLILDSAELNKEAKKCINVNHTKIKVKKQYLMVDRSTACLYLISIRIIGQAVTYMICYDDLHYFNPIFAQYYHIQQLNRENSIIVID